MISFISDIAAAFVEVKKNLSMITSAAGNGVTDAQSQDDGAEARFFARPMASVARAAKKSILYYPVVVSDTISPQSATIITKAVQVRAAEYTRLMVANMGPISAASSGKLEVIRALRGASLKDAFLRESVAAEMGNFTPTLISEAVDCLVIETGLNEAIEHRTLILEGKGNKHRRNKRDDDLYAGPQYASAMPADENGFRTHVSTPQATLVGGARTPAELAAMRFTSELIELDLMIKRGDLVSREAARKRLDKILRSPEYATVPTDLDIKDFDKLHKAGIGGLMAELEADAEFRKNRAAAARQTGPTPEEIERKRRDEVVDKAISLANMRDGAGGISRRGTQQAAELVQSILASGDMTGIGRLRQNKETARILEMLEKLPNAVIRDGAVDMTRSGNSVSVVNNIDINKLNQFLPVILSMDIRYSDASGVPMDRSDVITVGVKGVTHPVPSLDLVTGLGTSLQRDNLFLQFFRMSTGETSFVKDFVLNVDVAKSRASGRTTSGRKVLETLRRQAEWNARRSNWVIASVTKRGYVPPTSTIVITADEVDRIRNIYNVDFSKPSVVRDLLRSHNLMGFMIVDEAVGLVRVFEDGDDDFDRVPMDTLKSQGKETSVKDIMTILANGR